MRYTRYNYKKKGNNDAVKFIASLVATIAIAGVVGVGIAKIAFDVLPKNNAGTSLEQPSEQTNAESQGGIQGEGGAITANTNNTAFEFVQCGYFSSQENANQVLSKIGTGYGSFISEDNGKYRVFAGIYTDSEVQSAIDDLKSKGIDSVKVSVSLSSTDEAQSQIAGICDGYLKLLEASFGQDVAHIKTQDFKEWVSKLENVNEGQSVDVLNTLKTYISELPEEIKKDEVGKEMDYLYDVLSRFK